MWAKTFEEVISTGADDMQEVIAFEREKEEASDRIRFVNERIGHKNYAIFYTGIIALAMVMVAVAYVCLRRYITDLY
jgi:uncharacterized membrane protein YgcG